MRSETEDLKAALYEQWEYNHGEHCTTAWPHSGQCYWPLHRLLKGVPAPESEKPYYLRPEDHA